MQISDKMIQEFKEIYKKKTGKELDNSEAAEQARSLLRFVEIMYECAQDESAKQRRLKKEPEGFHLTDGTYNCLICHCSITGESSWYDQLGPKCLICQRAVKDGIIPAFVCKNRDSWYADWELKNKFGISGPTARKLIRKGELKARIIMANNGSPYEYVFLKKENPDLVDPDRYTSERKSYDRNRKKGSAIWAKEEAKKWKEEILKRKFSRPRSR